MSPYLIRVLIIDGHPAIREALLALLEASVHFIPAAPPQGIDDNTVEVAAQTQPDIILLGRNSAYDALELTGQLKQCCPKTRLIILTTYDDNDFTAQAVKAGASAVVPKNTPLEGLVTVLYQISGKKKDDKPGHTFAPHHRAFHPRRNGWHTPQGTADGLAHYTYY